MAALFSLRPAVPCILSAGLFAGMFMPHVARAGMVARPVSWTYGHTRFESVLVYDDAVAARRPGLLMVPAWFGVNANAIRKAEQIAGQRYVILLTDMYGATVRPRTTEQARSAVSPLLADRALMRGRVNYALGQLRAQAASAPVDVSHLAAIGFCFGGAAVLDLARSGADVAAVVAFHGNLGTDDPALARHIRARVLAMNGADDETTSPQFGSFTQEMRGSPAPWQFVLIGHAVHCFTETEATAPSGLCRYDPLAAGQSYALMRQWLADAFAAAP
ncbi:dienelactone hydrolase family protein [Komagataeibacter sp. FNDCR2]|uniref:dienelactone hydrolase family protein n=1 Tax=Komagataeibacter sp. FNDCR2 TaxID=2878682 RepID=UPI001E361DCA|nr:dienelactone hydrolase family protein [Komagataeibacter sp. FNDCR2]MCE2574255.1 dienelactone hydrolase family protein [Komagataeibacter sp. FNDCR2]